MSGAYFNPIKRIFLNLSGGTVTGDTVFTEGVYVASLSGGTIFSGSTNLDTIIRSLLNGEINGEFLPISGGTGGPYLFTGGTTADTTTILTTFNINDNFIISGNTGRISTYGGVTGVGLVGKFLSGVTGGFVLGDISDISGGVSGNSTYVQPGTNTTTGGTDNLPTINLVDSPSVNNLTFSGTATGGNLIGTNLSATTFFSASTNLETIIYNIANSVDTNDITRVQPGTNISTGGTPNNPTVNVVASPSFTGLVSATGFTDSSLTNGRVTYAGVGGRLTDEALFEYDAGANLFKTQKIQIGNFGDTGTTTTIYGDLLIIGSAISGFTSELYIEDNLIELNFNPTASTISTSLGAGLSIQDGSGIGGTDVFLDIRGTSTGLANRSFATNIANIILSESGTTSSPNGVYVIKVGDTIDGGSY